MVQNLKKNLNSKFPKKIAFRGMKCQPKATYVLIIGVIVPAVSPKGQMSPTRTTHTRASCPPGTVALVPAISPQGWISLTQTPHPWASCPPGTVALGPAVSPKGWVSPTRTPHPWARCPPTAIIPYPDTPTLVSTIHYFYCKTLYIT